MQHPECEFRFEPIAEDDLARLHEWLKRPHVAQWWGPAEPIDELRDYCLAENAEPNATRAFIAWQGGQPIGFIQAYVVKGSGDGWWIEETDPGARGIDQFLANESMLGQGIGSSMVRAFLDHLFTDPAVTVVQTDPDPANERAIRAYARAGFRAIGNVVTPDGPALLMRVYRQESGSRCAVAA